jgi:hypothetical protein
VVQRFPKLRRNCVVQRFPKLRGSAVSKIAERVRKVIPLPIHRGNFSKLRFVEKRRNWDHRGDLRDHRGDLRDHRGDRDLRNHRGDLRDHPTSKLIVSAGL